MQFFPLSVFLATRWREKSWCSRILSTKTYYASSSTLRPRLQRSFLAKVHLFWKFKRKRNLCQFELNIRSWCWLQLDTCCRNRADKSRSPKGCSCLWACVCPAGWRECVFASGVLCQGRAIPASQADLGDRWSNEPTLPDLTGLKRGGSSMNRCRSISSSRCNTFPDSALPGIPGNLQIR